jgi:L-alanine-DL-glutamate epimerase-like enolase superfamily enzyme
MRIARVASTVHYFEIPIPLATQKKDIRRVVLCEVTTDDGLIGYGMADGLLMPWATQAALNNDIFEVVKGMDPRDSEALHERIWWKLNPRSVSGVIFSAISAIDIACWDLAGKAAGRTVAQLLGGFRDYADAYVTFGFPQYDLEELVASAKEQVRLGHHRLKMVVPHELGWRENVRRVRAVRDAIGASIDLMIDANQRFTPVEARLLCAEVEDLGLRWFEEPLYQNDAAALTELKLFTKIPLAAGQAEGHRWRMREFLERRALDIVQPNVCNDGGYTEARKVAHMAQAYNTQFTNGGGWGIFNLQLIAGLMNGMWAEFPLGMVEVARRLFKNPPEPTNGRVAVPKVPGHGLEPLKEALRDSLVTPKS